MCNLGRGTPEARVRAIALERELAPFAERLRRETFGAPDVPFSGVGDAIAWVKRNRGRRRPGPPQAFWRDAGTWRANVARRWGQYLDVRLVEPVLSYRDRTGTHTVRADADTPLGRLLIETRRLGERIGVTHAELVLHVLTGKVPSVPLVSFESRSGQQVVLRLNGRLSERGWRKVGKRVRQIGNRTRRKPASKDTAWLVERVRQLNGPPPKGTGTTAFWEQIKAEANRRAGAQVYADWHGPYQRYRRYLAREQQERRPMPEALDDD